MYEYLQSVEVDLGAHVRVGQRYDARHDVVVIPASEALLLEKCAVVQVTVESSGERSVEDPERESKRIIEAYEGLWTGSVIRCTSTEICFSLKAARGGVLKRVLAFRTTAVPPNSGNQRQALHGKTCAPT